MRKPYTKSEIEAIRFLAQIAGGSLDYVKASFLESEFQRLTGRFRASGAIYMAYWRDLKGHYDHLF